MIETQPIIVRRISRKNDVNLSWISRISGGTLTFGSANGALPSAIALRSSPPNYAHARKHTVGH